MAQTMIKTTPDVEKLLTVKDLMGIFHQSRTTVEKHYQEHGLPFFKLGNAVLFQRDDVRRFIEQNTRCQFNPDGCATCPCRVTCCYRGAANN